MPRALQSPPDAYLRRPGPSPLERCREAYAPFQDALREGLAAWFVADSVSRERRAAVWRRLAKRASPALMADLRKRIDRHRGVEA